MKTELTINVRAFPVTIRDERTGSVKEDTIVLEKQHLQAAQLVGQSSTELIYRTYNRAGYHVLDIGKPEKREISLNLEELYKAYCVHEAGKRERVSAT